MTVTTAAKTEWGAVVVATLRSVLVGPRAGQLAEAAPPPLAVRRAASALHRGQHPGFVCPSDASSGGDVAQRVDHAVTEQAVQLLQYAPPHGSQGESCAPFTLQRRLTDYGEGVFLASTANRAPLQPGTVVAFFPGRVYRGIPASATVEDPVGAWERHDWEENDKRISLKCGGLVDAGEWEDSRGATEAGSVGEGDHAPRVRAAADDGAGPRQPADDTGGCLSYLAEEHAVGHMINHPDPGAVPNVMECEVRLDLHRLLRHLGIPRRRVPYASSERWFYSRESGQWIMTPARESTPAVVMLTTRDIALDQELLFDYNLRANEEGRYPAWYVPRDATADAASEAAC